MNFMFLKFEKFLGISVKIFAEFDQLNGGYYQTKHFKANANGKMHVLDLKQAFLTLLINTG